MVEKQLSIKSRAVLSLIAEGQSYAQIVDGHSGITYLDIFHAAEEALQLNESQSDYQARLARIKEKHPRAYEKWSPEEDAELKLMRANGIGTQKLAEHFLRQPSAISSRLNKFDLE
ncbi:MAG: hypothetical protein IPG58_05185 [Acidobacteria bacterium]|nr:hypothetical protein [Acidobacteriota bacterium]